MPFAQATLSTDENAVTELGQDDGTFAGNVEYTYSGVNDTPNALGVSSAKGIALDATNHRLFVADGTNARILVFNLNSSNQLTSMIANNVIGATDFRGSNEGNCHNASTGGAQFDTNESLAFDATNNRLFVADQNCPRVDVFNTTTITNGMTASYVLGQSNPTYEGAACTQAGLEGPWDVAFDATNERLFVADTSGNRVLVYNVAPGTIATGENASYELGQAAGGSQFTSCTANQGGSASQSSLSSPRGITFDSADELLYVGDSINSRIMVFNVATGTIADGENASYELGQPSGTAFTSSSANQGNASPSQSSLSQPNGMAYDSANTRLFVADRNNHRILVFNTSSISNGENASYELGQASGGSEFTSGSVNQGNASPSQSSLDFPVYVAYDSGNTLLYVGDANNNRFMLFNVATGSIADGENASNELGQDDGTFAGTVKYTFNGANDAPNALGFNAPYGSTALDAVNHRLFVSDTDNNRVLVFNLNTDNSIKSGLSGMVASNVLGQANFRSNTALQCTASGLQLPQGLAFDAVNNRLFVADYVGNRVMVYNTSTITNGMNASYALGSFGSGLNQCPGVSCTQSEFGYSPNGIAFDATNERLFVGDRINNRVLVFNVATGSITTGENASYELGQASGGSAFTTCTANQGGSASQSSLDLPEGPAFDALDELLYVPDTGNNRVMIFNVAPGSIANGENASYELGQPSGTAFTSTGSAASQSGMHSPQGASFDPNTHRLFLGDELNERVTVFNVQPAYFSNGENASFVIGQTNFTNNSANSGGSISQSSLSIAGNVCLPPNYDPASTRLFISDNVNNRIMVFDGTALPQADYYLP